MSIHTFLSGKDASLTDSKLSAASGILHAQGIDSVFELTEKLRDGKFSLEDLEKDFIDAQFSVAQARFAVSEVGKVWDKETDARQSHFEFVSVSVKNPLADTNDTRASTTQEFDVQRSTKASRYSDQPDQISTFKDVNDYDTFATSANIFYIVAFFSSFQLTVSITSVGATVYTLRLGMSIIWLAQVSIICATISTFFTPALSAFSDQYNSPFGRRKPFILAGVVFSGISFLVLAFPSSSSSVLDIQYLIGMVLITFGQALVYTPLQAWIQESCKDQSDQLKLNTWMFVCGIIFAVIAAISVLALGSNALTIIFGLYVVFCGTFTSLLMYHVPNPILNKVPPQPPIIPSLRSCIRTKEFQVILSVSVLASTMANILGVLFFISFYTCFGLEKVSDTLHYLGVYAVTLMFLAVGGFVVANYAISAMEKLDVYHISAIACSVMTIILGCMAVPGAAYLDPAAAGDIPKSDLHLLGFVFAVGLCIQHFMFIPGSVAANLLLRDLIQFDYFLNDVDREAMYITAINTPTNVVSTFISQLLLGIAYATVFEDTSAGVDDDRILEKYSFNMNAPILIFCYFIFSAVLLLLSSRVLRDYPLTTGIADQINDVVKQRKIKKAAAAAEEELVTDISRKSSYEEVVQRMDKKGKSTGTSGADPTLYGGKRPVDETKLDDADNVNTFRIGSVMTIDNNTRTSVGESSLGNRGELKEGEITDFDTMMFWNFLSRNEVHVIAYSSPVASDSTRNAGLDKVKLQNRLALYLFVPLTIGVLIAAIVFQFQSGGNFATSLMAVFQVLVVYAYYESGRHWVLSRLSTLKLEDLYTYAKKADEINNKYTETLSDMLKRNAITEALAEGAGDDLVDTVEDGFRGSVQAKSTSAKSKGTALNTRRSLMFSKSNKGPNLVDEDPNEMEDVSDLSLPGYKRLYSYLGVVCLFSVLAILQAVF